MDTLLTFLATAAHVCSRVETAAREAKEFFDRTYLAVALPPDTEYQGFVSEQDYTEHLLINGVPLCDLAARSPRRYH